MYILVTFILLVVSSSRLLVLAEDQKRAYFDHVEVKWFAPFLSGGGYSSEAMAFASVLDKLDSNVLPFSMSMKMIHHGDSPNQSHIDRLTKYERDLLQAHFDLPAPSIGGLDGHTRDVLVIGGDSKQTKRVLQIVICHSEPGAWHAPQPRYHTQRCPPEAILTFTQYRVGRTMFETDTIPDGWPPRLQYMHEVWVPTSFSKSIFTRELAHAPGNTSVVIVGEPVDTDFFHPVRRRRVLNRLPSTLQSLQPYIESGASIFLFVGKWEERKGMRMLVRAFYQSIARDSAASCVLVVVTNAYHSTDQFEKEISTILYEENLRAEDDAPLKHLLITNIPQDHMPHLYSAATATVIPSTGEGWGRPHVESMACGTPVVATAWSGPTAYLNIENGYPLRHLRQLLREIHSDNMNGDAFSELKRRGLRARKDMVEKYSLEAFATVLGRELERIENNARISAMEMEREEVQEYFEQDEL
eukprot:GSChrysophyteH1.ASY1.ANO1.1730.1 assembled CDS